MSAHSHEPDKVLVDMIDYVYDYEISQESSLKRARLLLLDSFGCAIESLGDPSVRALIGPYVPGTIVPDGFRLPGTLIVEDAVKGAFDFGTMIRYLDHNDALGGTEWGHPSDNLGAIVAVMDVLSRRSSASGAHSRAEGRPMTVLTLLRAMIKAYEIEGCFQMANSFNSVGIDHTILVEVATTAVISWLSGLSRQEALAALSQAWMDGHPLRTYRAFPNAIPRKGWAAGEACSRAVHLLHLTMRGQPGAPRPLTAKRWGFYDALFKGKQFEFPAPYKEVIIHNTVIKLFACEGHVLTAAEAALHVSQEMAKRNLDPARHIKKIKARTQKPAMLITNKTGDLINPADRDHCYQYIVAVVLVKGELPTAADYRDDSPWASSAVIKDLRDKMELYEDEQFTRDYYDPQIRSAASGISVMLDDGTWLDEAEVHVPIGHPQSPQTTIRAVEKYRSNLNTLFTAAEIHQIEKAVETDNMPVSEFIDLWQRNRKNESVL